MLNNENRLCCPVEKSPLIFSTPRTAVDLSNRAVPELTKAVKYQRNTFHGRGRFFVLFFASSSLKSNACRLEAKNYTGLGILRKVLQKVDRSKASGRHQASCHLFYCFSVSPRVKGRGAKCAWERLSLTRCMCLYQSVTHTVRL